MVNGVVGPGQRAVAASIGGGELIIAVKFLARFYVKGKRLAMFEVNASGVGIENKGCFDQVAVILQQPIDTIGFASLFVSGERQNEVAIGPEAFFLQANECGHQNGVRFPSYPVCRAHKNSHPFRQIEMDR